MAASLNFQQVMEGLRSASPVTKERLRARLVEYGNVLSQRIQSMSHLSSMEVAMRQQCGLPLDRRQRSSNRSTSRRSASRQPTNNETAAACGAMTTLSEVRELPRDTLETSHTASCAPCASDVPQPLAKGPDFDSAHDQIRAVLSEWKENNRNSIHTSEPGEPRRVSRASVERRLLEARHRNKILRDEVVRHVSQYFDDARQTESLQADSSVADSSAQVTAAQPCWCAACTSYTTEQVSDVMGRIFRELQADDEDDQEDTRSKAALTSALQERDLLRLRRVELLTQRIHYARIRCALRGALQTWSSGCCPRQSSREPTEAEFDAAPSVEVSAGRVLDCLHEIAASWGALKRRDVRVQEDLDALHRSGEALSALSMLSELLWLMEDELRTA